ncbi:MAG TPA: FKBP-type peptidyl-prolyl cis-trans isomerase [Magnetospirillaceae bacterium]|nr:FKBP-type peptidyl-prolyl cis-trans isomerase [Magnetospirillaceae bacterium]
MQSTKKSTRIIIWVIAIAMAGGFIGSSFLMIFNNNAATDQTNQTTNPTPTGQPDPNAFKVEGPVGQLGITDIKVGTGAVAQVGDSITVHYKGTLAQTGIKFDSSYDRGEPITLALQAPSATQPGVIRGWVTGIDGMKVGGKRRLVIPASLAYGDEAQETIPANSDLVFEVELLNVAPPAPTSDL